MSKTSAPTIAITGASGYLGSTLVDYFAAKGWSVTALVRSPETAQPRPHVTYVHYDLTSANKSLSLAGVDLLVHAAYTKLSADSLAFQNNVDGAKKLLAISRRDKVSRNIFISSMSAHGQATSIYGKQKLEIERLFSDSRDSVLKCGLIIGDGGIVKDMADFMRTKHVVPLVDGGKQPLQIVALNDLCRVIEQVFKKDIGGTFVIANPTVYKYKEFYYKLAKRINARVLFVPVPFWALMLIFNMASLLKLPLDFGKDNLLGLKMLRSMDSNKDLERLGLELTGLDEALEMTSDGKK